MTNLISTSVARGLIQPDNSFDHMHKGASASASVKLYLRKTMLRTPRSWKRQTDDFLAQMTL